MDFQIEIIASEPIGADDRAADEYGYEILDGDGFTVLADDGFETVEEAEEAAEDALTRCFPPTAHQLRQGWSPSKHTHT